MGTDPKLRFDIKQVVAQGSLVFLQILAKRQPDAIGDEMVMIVRIRNGKVIDHWDIHEELKADSASNSVMAMAVFCKSLRSFPSLR